MPVRVEKVYLGDGLYAQFDGYQIALTAENGVEVLESVYLDPYVYKAFTRFVEDKTTFGTDKKE